MESEFRSTIYFDYESRCYSDNEFKHYHLHEIITKDNIFEIKAMFNKNEKYLIRVVEPTGSWFRIFRKEDL